MTVRSILKMKRKNFDIAKLFFLFLFHSLYNFKKGSLAEKLKPTVFHPKKQF